MYRKIIELMECPKCKNKFKIEEKETFKEEIISGYIGCDCGGKWEITEGVLDFGSEEQKGVNNWSEITREITFAELDRLIMKKTPQNQLQLQEKAKVFIADFIKEAKPDFIIDIATGRGMLLDKISSDLPPKTHLVCTDLSKTVLKADREKIKKKHPEAKISYIACDVTGLPFKDNSFDLVLSFFGVANMRASILPGLKETQRVLKGEGTFLNVSIVVKEESQSYKVLQENFGEKGKHFIDFVLCTGLLDFHKKSGFPRVDLKMIGESTAGKNELDLIPVEGDWLGVCLVQANKE